MGKKKSSANLQLDTAHYSPEIVQMMNETEVCLNCGVPLKYLKDKSKRRNRGYCSLACYYKKPPKFAYVEKEYGKPIKEVILELLNQNDNVTITANLLGMTRQGLYKYLHKNKIERIVYWRG